MAEEYRIDISLGATDSTGPAFQSASKRVSAFEKSMQRTEKQLNRMDRTRWQLTVHAIDRASSVITSINRRALSLTSRAFTITLRAADYATRPIRAVGNLLTSTLGLLGIAGGTWGGVVMPLQLAGQFEQTQIAFETMLGSAEKAQRFVREAQQFARETPFDTEGVLEGARLMMAFGFEVERVLPMMTVLGDTASGLGAGAEGIERMVRALGQMQAKGRVQAEELLQLQELGVPAAQILQEELGLTAKQVGNIGELGIESAKVIDALLVGMEKRYGGLMQQQSESFAGLWNNIKETFQTEILLKWGEGLRLGVQPHLRRLVEWVETNQATIERWGATLQDAGSRAAEWVIQKFGAAIEWVQELLESPEWQQAEGLWEHLQVAWDKFWSGGGEDFFRHVGEQIKLAIQAGLGSIWDAFLGIQGTPAGYALDAFLIAQMLPGLASLISIGGGVARGGRGAWRWLRGLRGLGRGAVAAGAAGSTAAAAQAATAAATAATTAGKAVPILGPSGQVLSTVVQNADDLARVAGTGSRALGTFGRFAGALGKVGRLAGPVGAILGAGLGLLGLGSADDKGKVIGGAVGGGLGGWGGAAAGAAIGSAIAPGVGTIIGGIIGGLGGGFGGDWLGGKIGSWVGRQVAGGEQVPEPVSVTAAAGTGTVVVNVTANQTYRIETAADAEGVLRVIERNQQRIADLLADEIGESLETVFGNMTRTTVSSKAWGMVPS